MRDDDKRQTLKVKLLSQWKPEAEFLNICASLKLPQKNIAIYDVASTQNVVSTYNVASTNDIASTYDVASLKTEEFQPNCEGQV